ncbi:MAG: hypothetical protein D6690_07240 [Nitrospirae bacterium]|nr:MAG: hypothetical protein D6690_07240 [Nitrospirota bacterium]
MGISGDQITLSDDARVSAESAVFPAAGPAGNVVIAAGGTFEANDSMVTSSAELAAGGNVTITAGQDLLLTNDAIVAAQTQGPGDAGDILLEAGQTIRVTDSAVTTVAQQADGGNIKLTASDTIHVIDSDITSSVGGGAATVGGNISLDPQFIILQNSRILANAFEGQGGNITLIGDVVLADPFSTLDASSALGISGSVDVQAPIQNLSGTIAPLPQTPVRVAKLYADACAAQKGSKFSSFVARSQGGIPPLPGNFLPSPLRAIPNGSLHSKVSGNTMRVQGQMDRLGITEFSLNLNTRWQDDFSQAMEGCRLS